MEIDRSAATRFLIQRFGPGVGSVAELGAGDWSRAFSFRLGERDLVVRFGRHREDFERDRMAMGFARAELPVPCVLEVGEAPAGFYAVSERHFGVFLETLDERGWRRLMPSLLRALDALREMPPPGTGVDWAGGGDGHPDGWRDWLIASLVDRPGGRVSGWRARLSSTPDIEETFVRGERALRELLPACPEQRHLVHRDLLNRNVLVAPDATRLEAVFDWGCSIAGDPLYEIAWFTFWSPWYPALQALDFHRLIEEHHRAAGLALEGFDERLACYELHVGLEHVAYATFTGHDSLRDIARRTSRVLDSLPG